MQPPPFDTEPLPGPARTHERAHLRLFVAHCADPDLQHRFLPLRKPLVVGRVGTEANLPLDDRFLSKLHARITLSPDGAAVEVEDLGSTNGTFVDGARIHEPRPAAEGAVIRAGATVLVVCAGALELSVPPDKVLLGQSAAILGFLHELRQLAPTALSVLIEGETGSGKEVTAQRLHALSDRKGPCVAVNCAAIPDTLVEASLFGHRRGAFTGATSDNEGFFRRASGGTLFLDEVGELPLSLQPKLLRALDQREIIPVGETTPVPIDVRVVSATNVVLEDAVERGTFRRDLFARLAEAPLYLPPLRERREDIPLLLSAMLAGEAPDKQLGVDANFVEALLLHEWPMNVRELRSVIKRLAATSPPGTVLGESNLPPALVPERQPAGEEAPPSREELEALLRKHQGNVLRVARHLGRARSQMYRWIAKYNLDPKAYRR